jgi:transposase
LGNFALQNRFTMGRAIELGLREQFITLKQQGLTIKSICEQLGLHYGTACKLSAQLKKQGSLEVRYANCGAKKPLTSPLLVRAALWLKRRHSSWGAPFIHLKLTQRYGKEGIPAVRTIQNWFRRRGLTKPRQQLAEPSIGSAKAVHNIWQVDAKEHLTLPDGMEACYLTITDEHSGAGLDGLVFPPRPYLTSIGGRTPATAYPCLCALG